MSRKNIDRLYEAGLIPDRSTIPEKHAKFLSALSDNEVNVLIALKERLDAAGIPVQTYSPHVCMPIL